MMPVKADLVICSSIIVVAGYCKSVAFIYVKPLFEFQFLRDCSGVCKSNHIMHLVYVPYLNKPFQMISIALTGVDSEVKFTVLSK